MSDKVSVSWGSPVKLRDLVLNDDHRTNPEWRGKGIYAHFREFEGRARELTYIGRALGSPSLWQRHLDHYLNLIGGRYQIPSIHPEDSAWSICTGQRCSRDELERTFQTIGDCQRFTTIVQRAFEYAEHITVWLGVISDSPDGSAIKQAEGELIFALQPLENATGKVARPAPGPFCFEHRFVGGLPWGCATYGDMLSKVIPNHRLLPL